MIHYQDFFPELVKEGGILANDEYQSFNFLLARANAWILDEGINVINIETVVLRDRDSSKACFVAEEPFCYQFIRVWYVAEEQASEVEAATDQEVAVQSNQPLQ